MNGPCVRTNKLVRVAAGWIAAALFVVTVAVYLPTLRDDFINFDDPDYVYENPVVLHGLTGGGAKWAFTSDYANNWHPLTWISHMVDVQLYGLKPWGHHLTSVLLHGANTALLFLVLLRLTQRTWPSVFVAALFGLHPIHVESVAWVAERKDVLSTLFFLMTVVAYAKYVESRGASVQGPEVEGRGSRVESRDRGDQCSTLDARHATASSGRSTLDSRGPALFYALALVLFACGLMSKPMLVTLPFVLLLLDFWPLQRFKLSSWKALAVEKTPFFVLSLISSIVTVAVQRQHGNIPSVDVLPIDLRVATALQAYVSYICKIIWPARLAVFYPLSRRVNELWAGGAAIVLIGLCSVAYRVRARAPFVFIGWFLFVGTLVPVVGLVQVGLQSMADRYTYIPSIGFFLAVVWLVGDWRSDRRWSRSASVTGAVVLVGCIAATEQQIGFWRDSESVFAHALRVAPNNPTAQLNLGAALITKHQLAEAEMHFREALRVKPSYAPAEGNLGFVLAIQGKTEQAIEHYQAALRLAPGAAKFHYLFGRALLAEGRKDKAVAEFRKELELNPDHPLALNDLAWILATDPLAGTTERSQAVELARRACEITAFTQPQFIGTLAAAYAGAGKFEDAIKTADKARRLAEQLDQPELARKNEELLMLYHEHKPVTEQLNSK